MLRPPLLLPLLLLLLPLLLWPAAPLAAAGWEDHVPVGDPQRFADRLEVGAARAAGDGLEVTLANRGAAPLWYRGYGSEHPQLFHQHWVDGAWVAAGWDWCGTGLRQQRLDPGATVTVRLPAPAAGRRVRIGTLFADDAADAVDSRAMVWLATAP